jgi:FkbM family methyltransferase
MNDNDNIEMPNMNDNDNIEMPLWSQKGYPSEELMFWFEEDNDYYLLRDFNLNENSIVVDVGCFTGVWLKDMFCKYNCNCIGFEPLTKYFLKAQRILQNPKVKLDNFGLTVDQTNYESMSDSGDASSLFHQTGNNTQVLLKNIMQVSSVFDQFIDVLQVNIEGYEYKLLPFMIQNNLLSKVKNIQIQFHNNIDGAETQMLDIINNLEQIGFKTKFNYKFVWYGATRE